ncbi:MAG: hypothetical protein H8D26_09410 [Methanomicrobia archaeon]|nr:hypothetical protein [Methanomicrobia archaeon]
MKKVQVKMLFRATLKAIAMSSSWPPIFILIFAAILFEFRLATPALLVFVQLLLEIKKRRGPFCILTYFSFLF